MPSLPAPRLVPNLRRGHRGHYLRHVTQRPVLVTPTPKVTPPPRGTPTLDLRVLCCEGACSPGQVDFAHKEHALRGIGYTEGNLRSTETGYLRPTPHYFVRTSQMGSTVYQMWACTTCGNERVYGAEEA